MTTPRRSAVHAVRRGVQRGSRGMRRWRRRRNRTRERSEVRFASPRLASPRLTPLEDVYEYVCTYTRLSETAFFSTRSQEISNFSRHFYIFTFLRRRDGEETFCSAAIFARRAGFQNIARVREQMHTEKKMYPYRG